MASPEAGDSHYFSAWTLVDDSAGAKTIHFITAALTGEPSAIFTGEPFLVYKSEFNEVQSWKLRCELFQMAVRRDLMSSVGARARVST